MGKTDFTATYISTIEAKMNVLKAELDALKALPKISKCNCNLDGAEIYWAGDTGSCVLSCTACKRSTGSATPSSSIALWNKMNGK